MQKTNKNIAFFERGSWYHRTKTIQGDGTVKYEKKGGFKTQEETEISYKKYNEEFREKTKVYLEEWLMEKKKHISNDSYITFKNTINKYINPCIGNVYITNLNNSHIKKLFNTLEDKSASTIKNVKSVLSIALDYAKEKQLIKSNPAKGFKLPKKLLLKINKAKKCDKKVLNINQINTLIKASKGSKVYMQILFATLMGLRRGEINGLKYSDVNFISQKLKVQRQLGIKPNTKKEDFEVKTYTKQEVCLKTKNSYRCIDIPDILFEAIIEEQKKYEKNKRRRINCKTTPFIDDNFICCSTLGHSRSKGFHPKYYDKLLKENNLPKIRFHDLRHKYGTILLKANFDAKAVSKILGHASEIITVDVYCDTEEIIYDCLETLEPFINEIAPTSNESINDLSLNEELNCAYNKMENMLLM